MPLRQNTILITAILVILTSLLVDLHLTRKYGGTDLRDKVVGSRSLLEGRSPWMEPWRPGDPERFADPLVPPGSEYTRFTGSPYQALLMSPMVIVPFPVMRMAWLFGQYALLLISIGLVLKAFGAGNDKAALMGLLVLVVIVASGAWRLHVERGQIYVIFALLLAGLFLAARTRSHDVIGAIGVMMILLKPTFGLLLLPLIFKLNMRMLAGGLAMLVVSLAPFLTLPDGFNSWKQYSEAMQVWSAHPGYGYIPPPVPMDFEYPAVIEGTTNLSLSHDMEMEQGSIGAILYHFGLELPPVLPYILTMIIMVAVLLVYWRKLKHASAPDLLLIGFCINTILMMLLPVLRFHYQFVFWVAPLLYVLLTWRDAPRAWHLGMGVAGLLVIGALDILPVNVLLAEILLLALFAYFIWHRFRRQDEQLVIAPAMEKAALR